MPDNLKEKYLEVWRADKDPSAASGIRGLVLQVQFLSLSMRLRWQDEGFKAARMAVWLSGSLGILWLYAEFSFLRDLLELVVIWWMANSLDFRATHSRRALKATSCHLGVSFISFGVAVIVHHIVTLKDPPLAQEFHWLAIFAGWILGVSFLTAVGASICWFIDFWNTRNVFVTGKIFSTMAAVFLGILWLQQSVNVSNLIDPSSWLSNALKPVSRVQQVTTNLVVPLLLVLAALHYVNKIQRKPTASMAKPTRHV